VQVVSVTEPGRGLGEQRVVEAHAARRHLGDDALAHRGIEPVAGFGRGAGVGKREQREGRARAGDRGGRQQRSSVIAEPIERPLEDLPDHAAPVGGAHELLHEQRIAGCPRMERDRVHRCRGLRGRQPANAIDVEPAQLHHSGHASHPIETGHPVLVIPTGRDQRDGSVAEGPRQVVEHPDRDWVGPVQVLEHHQRRLARAQRVGQRFEMFPPSLLDRQ